MRIYATVTKEELDQLKREAGILPLSIFFRSKLFTTDVVKDDTLKKWVEIISKSIDYKGRYDSFISKCKRVDADPVDIFNKHFPL